MTVTTAKDISWQKEWLAEHASGSADWRRRKADEYPDDVRNIQAAESLEALEAYLLALDDNHPLFVAMASMSDGAGGVFTEWLNQELGGIHGTSSPEYFVAEALSQVQDAIESYPDTE